MVNTNLLKGTIVAKGLTMTEVALRLGMSRKCFYERMKKGVFNSNEIYQMIKIVEIENPCEIFFAPEVTQQVTESHSK